MSLRRMWGSPGKANSQWAPEVPDGLPAPRYPEHSTSCPAGEWAGSLAWQGAGQVATFPAQSCCTSAFPGLLLTLLRPAEWIRPLRGLASIESVIPCLLSQQSGCKGPRTTSQQVVPRDFVGPQLCKFMETLLSRLLPFFSFPGWGTFLQVSWACPEGSGIRVSTEYAAQVAADGPSVLGKPRWATGPAASPPDPGAASTGPAAPHPDAQPDSLPWRRPVSPAHPTRGLAGPTPRPGGTRKLRPPHPLPVLAGLSPHRRRVTHYTTWGDKRPSSWPQFLVLKMSRRQKGKVRNQEGTMDALGCVACLGWWRRWWVLGFQSHHVPCCPLSWLFILLHQ